VRETVEAVVAVNEISEDKKQNPMDYLVKAEKRNTIAEKNENWVRGASLRHKRAEDKALYEDSMAHIMNHMIKKANKILELKRPEN